MGDGCVSRRSEREPLEKLGLFLKDTSADEDIEAELLEREGDLGFS